jgi:hypothetical protein
MATIPPVEQSQLIEHIAYIIGAIPSLSGTPVKVEFARGETGLVIKANGGTYKQKRYINGTAGDYVGEFAFMLLNVVEHTDGMDSVLAATKPLSDVADYFDTLNAANMSLGGRKGVKMEMTSRPQDMAGVQEDGTATFFAVYTLTYRKKGE